VPKLLRARPAADSVEEQKVHKLAGAWHAPADWVLRARIVECGWQGMRVPAIADKLGCHQKTVRRWVERFNAGGLDGLGDRPGAGRKRRITEAGRSQIIAWSTPRPRDGWCPGAGRRG
jgi:transposase